MSLDMKLLQQWIGKQQEQSELVSMSQVKALAATLNRPQEKFIPGSALPPLWHWIYFNSPASQPELGDDGHARKGGFLPPIDLPRRMWAGGKLQFKRPLLAGQRIRRLSTIQSIDLKQGRSGQLAFVNVRHEIENDAGVAVVEDHNIVYRDKPAQSEPSESVSAPPVVAPENPTFCLEITPDPVLLFRYSAVTFNSHRIHYDRDYVTKVEGYPGLLVHGPLLATLLTELLQQNFPEHFMEKFDFKAVRPVFEGNQLRACAEPKSDSEVELWISDHENYLCMQASATIAPKSRQGNLL